MDPHKQPRPTAPVDQVPLLDVGRGNRVVRDEIREAIQAVCDSGRFLHGPECGGLEASIAEYCKVDHAIGCASGSDALLLALMALDIGPGDEVIVPSFTFFATASAVWRLGATPVFVDIERDSFNIDPRRIAEAITDDTKAIIPVHLFGQCADMQAICELAREHQIKVIEDAAQAIGAEHRQRPAGSWGDMGCFSFYPTKNLGAFGDGGMLVTNNPDHAARLRLLASHGMQPRYYHSEVGINSRLDTIQAAVLQVKLPRLPEATLRRRENADRYAQLFADAGLDSAICLPREGEGQHHVWNQYTIRVAGGRRDALRQFLAEHQVGSEIYYPVPLHRQACFHNMRHPHSLRETDLAAEQVLSLPIFPELTAAEQQRVVEMIGDFVAKEKLLAA
ncbi:MAG: DegT/DnrJ/EryC1/StrS family aminotransferase [Planctomycetales bacterium]|nr:DegT/DnrJ/EryC1/StrS family aminotransferase [Planctomycetales bacterium]